MLDTMSRLPKLELDHEEWDLRGWPLRDPGGRTLGTISELIVDTKTQSVVEVMLRDGRKYRAHDVFIGDHFATLGDVLPAASIPTKVATTGKAAPATGAAATASTAPSNLQEKLQGSGSLRDEDSGADLVIPIIEEELDVGTRRYDAGGVRIETHVTREPIQRAVVVREEHVTIERKRVDRPLRGDEADVRLREEEIEMRAVSEIPVTQKRAHVVEEIVVTKDITERLETVADTLRHTEAEVTQLPGDPKVSRRK
jgi:uncharacterized protein (TIGR02271 family)